MASLWEAVASNFGSLFGFAFPRNTDSETKAPSFAPKENDDGSVVIPSTGGFYGTYVDLDGSIRTEAELITKYRDMTSHSEIDSAIEDIVCEAIVSEDGEKTVQIVLDDVPDLPEKLIDIINDEFDEVQKLLEFNTKSYSVFRRWYIDGRLYYHVIIDPTDPGSGIKELRYLDPRRIRKIREVANVKTPGSPVTVTKTVNEYYLYSNRDFSKASSQSGVQNTSALKIAPDSIVQSTSGLLDTNNKMVLSYLQVAIKPLNCLRSIEDAIVIYRVSRASERRVFYIDVGNLPKAKADQYIRDIMTKHRNKLVYDQTTGNISDTRKFMTLVEDYWLPRRGGNKITEIDTLPGAQNLGQLDDLKYFQNKLYKALHVPIDRLDDGALYNIGRATQITRTEVKFAKFIDRLRLKFSDLFIKILGKQLVLKGHITADEWDQWKGQIKFRFLSDNDFAELKDQEILNGRITTLTELQPFVGVYFSHEWVRRNILHQDDDDIKEIDAQIKKELTIPQYQRPVDIMGNDMSQLPPPVSGPNAEPTAPPAPTNESELIAESRVKAFPKYRKRKPK